MTKLLHRWETNLAWDIWIKIHQVCIVTNPLPGIQMFLQNVWLLFAAHSLFQEMGLITLSWYVAETWAVKCHAYNYNVRLASCIGMCVREIITIWHPTSSLLFSWIFVLIFIVLAFCITFCLHNYITKPCTLGEHDSL